MKYLLIALALLTGNTLFAQDACQQPHPVFPTLLDNYSLRKCEDKAKDKLSLYEDIPGGLTQVIKKEGRLLMFNFQFNGEYEKRPTVSQILKFHEDAAKKSGVQVLSKTNKAIYFKATKDKMTYWIYLTTDATGDYFLYTLVEPATQP
jgi:hypothetical protein